MTATERPMTEEEKARFNLLNKENLEFLMDRYNRVNRWVIADMVRRTAYHYPDKTALIFGDISLTYAELEAACNRTANALAGLGVRKYDRVAILAHNTLHHVLTWLGCCKIGAVYLAINYLLRGPDIAYANRSWPASRSPRASSSWKPSPRPLRARSSSVTCAKPTAIFSRESAISKHRVLRRAPRSAGKDEISLFQAFPALK